MNKIFHLNVSLEKVIISDSEDEMCFFITLISFLIFKEWLLFSGNENWKTHNIITFVHWELKIKLKVYEKLGNKWQIICHYIKLCITHINED